MEICTIVDLLKRDRTEVEDFGSCGCGWSEILRKDYNVYALSKEFREIEHETGHCYGKDEPESCVER